MNKTMGSFDEFLESNNKTRIVIIIGKNFAKLVFCHNALCEANICFICQWEKELGKRAVPSY